MLREAGVPLVNWIVRVGGSGTAAPMVPVILVTLVCHMGRLRLL